MFPERRGPESAARGFSLVTAVFLLVVLAALGAFILTVSGLLSSSATLDVKGARAYQAARAGIEWGAYTMLRPPAPPACSVTDLTFAGTGLAEFTSSVTCSSGTASEAGATVTTYQLTATACNQPAGGKCPNPAPGANYVERQLTATLSR